MVFSFMSLFGFDGFDLILIRMSLYAQLCISLLDLIYFTPFPHPHRKTGLPKVKPYIVLVVGKF